MADHGTIRIGTSGWHYKHWRGPFYPAKLPVAEMFDFYAARFDAVEINNTFYQLPKEGILSRWSQAAPRGFEFAVKGSRYATHMKKLKDPENSTYRLFERLEELGRACGPVLFQLPPRWRANPDRLDAFLDRMPATYRYAVEFRDPSWFDETIYAILRKHNAAFCLYELAGTESPRQVTADFVYIRLHGPADTAYQGDYDTGHLSGWAGAISAWARQGRDVYCFFDNDQNGYAPKNAAELADMLAGH